MNDSKQANDKVMFAFILRKYLINEIPKLHYKQAMVVTMHTNPFAVPCCNVILSDETWFVFSIFMYACFFQKVNIIFS